MVKKAEQNLPGHPRLNGYWHASEAWPDPPVIPAWCKATKQLEREYWVGVEDFLRWSRTEIGVRALERRR